MKNKQTFDVLLANPRGFCAGVDRAIEIVQRALDIIGAPIYVRHEVVHNRYVVNDLRSKGAIFVDEISEVPDGQTVIFSAHGVSQQVRNETKHRGLRFLDATCPLVTKVHMEVARCSRYGYECILIGHAGHPEVEGTLGQYDNAEGGMYLVESVEDVQALKVKNPDNLFYVTQTTLSVDDTAKIIDAIQQRFPTVASPKKEDICYATTNRQHAVKQIAEKCDVVIVVGSVNSSNSNRLRELAERLGCEAYLVDSADEVKSTWVTGKQRIGVTAGASAPEVLVQQIIAKLIDMGGVVTEQAGREENIVFVLPKELREEELSN